MTRRPAPTVADELAAVERELERLDQAPLACTCSPECAEANADRRRSYRHTLARQADELRSLVDRSGR